MADVMMQHGLFQFAIGTAAYQRLTRTAEYRWERQSRLGTNDALQFTGYGGETIELEGVIYPHFSGGLNQVETMRKQAALGLPLPLVSGLGRVLGMWVTESVTEGQMVFAAEGIPHRMDFSLRLRRYDGGIFTQLLF